MKKYGKILAVTAAIVMCLTMAFGLAACGESAATVTNVYSAGGKYVSVPDSAQELKNVSMLNVTVYSDNTYVLVEEQGGYMAKYGGTEAGHFTNVWYGTFTQEAGAEEGMITLKLSKPTRIIYRMFNMAGGTKYYDTDKAETFTPEDGEEDPLTKDALMEKGKEYTLTVDTATNTIKDGVKPGDITALLFA